MEACIAAAQHALLHLAALALTSLWPHSAGGSSTDLTLLHLTAAAQAQLTAGPDAFQPPPLARGGGPHTLAAAVQPLQQPLPSACAPLQRPAPQHLPCSTLRPNTLPCSPLLSTLRPNTPALLRLTVLRRSCWMKRPLVTLCTLRLYGLGLKLWFSRYSVAL